MEFTFVENVTSTNPKSAITTADIMQTDFGIFVFATAKYTSTVQIAVSASANCVSTAITASFKEDKIETMVEFASAKAAIDERLLINSFGAKKKTKTKNSKNRIEITVLFVLVLMEITSLFKICGFTTDFTVIIS